MFTDPYERVDWHRPRVEHSWEDKLKKFYAKDFEVEEVGEYRVATFPCGSAVLYVRSKPLLVYTSFSDTFCRSAGLEPETELQLLFDWMTALERMLNVTVEIIAYAKLLSIVESMEFTAAVLEA